MFNALDLMDNATVLRNLKFGVGDGKLQVRRAVRCGHAAAAAAPTGTRRSHRRLPPHHHHHHYRCTRTRFLCSITSTTGSAPPWSLPSWAWCCCEAPAAGRPRVWQAGRLAGRQAGSGVRSLTPSSGRRGGTTPGAGGTCRGPFLPSLPLAQLEALAMSVACSRWQARRDARTLTVEWLPCCRRHNRCASSAVPASRELRMSAPIVTIKLQRADEVRRCDFSKPVTFAALVDRVRGHWPATAAASVRLTFTDGDGDQCSLWDDDSVAAALALAGDAPLKVKVVSDGESPRCRVRALQCDCARAPRGQSGGTGARPHFSCVQCDIFQRPCTVGGERGVPRAICPHGGGGGGRARAR